MTTMPAIADLDCQDAQAVLDGLRARGAWITDSPTGRPLILTRDAALLMDAELRNLGRRPPSTSPYSPASFRNAIARAINADPDFGARVKHDGPHPNMPLWDAFTLAAWIRGRPGSGQHKPDAVRAPERPYDPNRITPEELRAHRVARGITQQQLADELGVSKTTIGYWEQGRTHTPSDLAERLASLTRAT